MLQLTVYGDGDSPTCQGGGMLGDLGDWYAPLPLLSGAELSLVCGSGTLDGMNNAVGYMLMIYNCIDQTQITPKPPTKQLLWNSQRDSKTKSTPSETFYLSYFTSHELLKRIHNAILCLERGSMLEKMADNWNKYQGRTRDALITGSVGIFICEGDG
jgi:hypothetical protein